MKHSKKEGAEAKGFGLKGDGKPANKTITTAQETQEPANPEEPAGSSVLPATAGSPAPSKTIRTTLPELCKLLGIGEVKKAEISDGSLIGDGWKLIISPNDLFPTDDVPLPRGEGDQEYWEARALKAGTTARIGYWAWVADQGGMGGDDVIEDALIAMGKKRKPLLRRARSKSQLLVKVSPRLKAAALEVD